MPQSIGCVVLIIQSSESPTVQNSIHLPPMAPETHRNTMLQTYPQQDVNLQLRH